MVKVLFSPATELIIHEAVEVTKDDLLLERITPQGNLPLYWCNGILFSFSSVPMTEEIVREYLKGRIHWLEVHFTRMDKYVPVITFESAEYKSTMNVKIIDTSASELHKEFISWLKSNAKKKAQ
ncbi:MAG: hypothetical protein M1286_04005 [Candidatus Marsarchaeota archaeon]|nr:hypothetical protein [Candidatus Marsarchaeota archaeon]